MDAARADAADGAHAEAVEVVLLVDAQAHAGHAPEGGTHALHEALGVDVAAGRVAEVAGEGDGVRDVGVVAGIGAALRAGALADEGDGEVILLGFGFESGVGVAAELHAQREVGEGEGGVGVELARHNGDGILA